MAIATEETDDVEAAEPVRVIPRLQNFVLANGWAIDTALYVRRRNRQIYVREEFGPLARKIFERCEGLFPFMAIVMGTIALVISVIVFLHFGSYAKATVAGLFLLPGVIVTTMLFRGMSQVWPEPLRHFFRVNAALEKRLIADIEAYNTWVNNTAVPDDLAEAIVEAGERRRMELLERATAYLVAMDAVLDHCLSTQQLFASRASMENVLPSHGDMRKTLMTAPYTAILRRTEELLAEARALQVPNRRLERLRKELTV
jgi:hypothetical protein